MPSKTVIVGSAIGLHARPAAIIAEAVVEAGVPVTLSMDGGEPVDAGSALMIMTLGAGNGAQVTVSSDDENAMNTIAELVHQRPVEAERMITGLSHLLRETLHAGLVDRVPLDRELQLLDHYVEIQRARFGDRLSVAIDVDEKARDALVPSLFLQPLVENSIKHGIGARAGAGRIELTATSPRGTTFCVHLAAGDVAPSPEAPSPQSAAPGSPAPQSLRVEPRPPAPLAEEVPAT